MDSSFKIGAAAFLATVAILAIPAPGEGARTTAVESSAPPAPGVIPSR